MSRMYQKTGADNWGYNSTSPMTDSDRMRKHGALLPMDKPPGFLARLFLGKK